MSRHHTFLFTVDDKTVIDAAVERQRRSLHQSLVRSELRSDQRSQADLHRGDQDDSRRHGARVRLSVRAHRRPHRGGRAVLQVPVRLAEVPRDDPRTRSGQRLTCGRPRGHPAGHDAQAGGLRGTLSAGRALDAGRDRSLRIASAVARRVDARPVRRSGRAARRAGRVRRAAAATAAARHGESVRWSARTRQRGSARFARSTARSAVA